MDGHPLAQRGEAARALSASFIASMIGGLVGALILLLAIPVARPIILSFRTPDLFMLTLFGLSMISLMAGKHPLRSEEHTSELQSLMRISYAVFCLKKTNNNKTQNIV